MPAAHVGVACAQRRVWFFDFGRQSARHKLTNLADGDGEISLLRKGFRVGISASPLVGSGAGRGGAEAGVGSGEGDAIVFLSS